MIKIKPLPHKNIFRSQLQKAFLITCGIIIFSLMIGTMGYMYFYHLSWVDGLYNASMILTGMGPVNNAPDNAAKIFSSIYALYSGIAFLTSLSVMITPIYKRYLHKIHINMFENEND